MEDRTGTLICERSDDLIAFLYQELDEREVRNFEKHLADCVSCSREMVSFSEIRNGVITWREQSLGIINQPSGISFNYADKPSALAAFRQFFALSPLWLKGTVAFATFLLFAAIAFLVISLNSKPAAPLASTDKVYSEAELRAKVEAEIQARLKEVKPQDDGMKEELATAPVPTQQPRSIPKSSVYPAKTRRAPLTKFEREQLAADLGLISPTEDDLNLLSEQINR